MLKKEYYCLVAGLPDLLFAENKPGISTFAFKEELELQLANADLELTKLLFLPFDNQNLLNFYFKREVSFNILGTISKRHLEEQFSPENEELNLPGYMLQFISWVKETEHKELTPKVTNTIQSLYYEMALKTRNKFLARWFSFDVNLKNIITAYNCVKYNYEPEAHLIQVPTQSVVYSLLLHKRFKPELYEDELPFVNQIFKIAESDFIPIEKEKAIDKLRWEYLDEHTFFHYFSIEKILSFIIKLLITERWMKLDEDTGKEMLDKLIDELKTSYSFREEDSLTK